MKRLHKRLILIVSVMVFFASIALVLILPGKIVAVVSDGNLTVSHYYLGSKPLAETTIDLTDFEVIFYEEHFEEGGKIEGSGQAFVKSGRYKSDSFGEYRLFRHKRGKSVIILKSDYSNVVVGLKSTQKTLDLYNAILAEQQSMVK